MRNDVMAELWKQKHSFNTLLIGLVPLITLITATLLMGPHYIQSASYNWWYILFLPFTFTYISSTIILKDQKFNFHGLFGIIIAKKNIWYAKVIVATLYLFITCMIFSALIALLGLIVNEQISILANVYASLILFITFSWQIPLFMFISLKLNLFISIILSVGCNFLIACLVAIKSWWWIPFAIPARLMCPIIKVLPNGLPLPNDSLLGNPNVITAGLLITVTLYILVTLITAKYFERQEV